jgi:hypothetical protein
VKSLFALFILAAAVSMCGVGGRLWNKNASAPAVAPAGAPANAPAGASAMSDDDKHKLFQAAAQCGDTQLRLEALKRMCLSPGENASREEFEKFVQAHTTWAAKNVLFVMSMSSQAKARDYVLQHMPPADADCPAPEKGSAAAQQDACALVSMSEVADATGMPVGYTNLVKYTGNQSECDYRPSKGSLRGVLVLVNWQGGTAALKKALADEGANATKLEGVGDEAYAAGASFYARKGDALVTIQIVGSPGNANAKARALAQKIVERL